MPDEKTIGQVAQIAEAAAKVLPVAQVYEDLAQPAVKEVGGALKTVAQLIPVALAPLSAIIWSYDRIKGYLEAALGERLKHIPPERIQIPDLTVAGPAVEALRFAAHEPTLREMYATLLATAMDKESAKLAHPGFVEILKQLTPDEARILKVFRERDTHALVNVRSEKKGGGGGIDVLSSFSLLGELAGCSLPSQVPAYLDNMRRLGILWTPTDRLLSDETLYRPLVEHVIVRACVLRLEKDPAMKAHVTHSLIKTTTLGVQFINACIGPVGEDAVSSPTKADPGVWG